MKHLLLFSILILSTVAYAQNISVTQLGRYTDGRDAACEISAYNAATKRLFTTNAASYSIDIFDINNPATPTKIGGVDVSNYGGGVNSVVNLGNDYFAAAIEDTVKQDSGKVVFFDTDGTYITHVMAGALPDMITVSPDGQKILVANEGEPNDDYTVDPEGSITIIDISGGIANVTSSDVTHLNFNAAPTSIPGGLKKPGTTWAVDLEPEYIAINESSTVALVVCQENNVAIIVNLLNNSIVAYTGLGFKDHSVAGNGFDASNEDNGINIQNWNVKGVYQPDAIASFDANNATYFISANEGDARDYDGYSSETRIKDLVLDSATFAGMPNIQDDAMLGRLKTFTADMIGDTDNDGDVDELYSYGARSFSIWDQTGALVWDSGDAIEQYMAANHPSFFNCNSGLASKSDSRSDDKGAEPEAVTIGKIGNRIYAFIGLERQGGVLVYEVSNPSAPTFETFIHNFDTAMGTMVDISPEGLIFVPASESHTGTNLLIVSHEFSGTTTIYEIGDLLSNVNVLEEATNVRIYPNPASDYINIEIDQSKAEVLQYVITNAVGQTVLTGSMNDSSLSLNISNLAKGVYGITLFNKEQSQLIKTTTIVKY